MKVIYKMKLNFSKNSSLEGIFVCTKQQLEDLIYLGNEICFGAAFGKNSDVTAVLEIKDFEVVTDDQKFVELFEKHDLANGFNPFDYIED